MKFSTLFLETRNEHLTKDVGAIPYFMMRLEDYNSEIVTYCNDSGYINLNSDLKGVKLTFVKKTIFGEMLDGAAFLLKKGKSIDILNIYHLSVKNVLWASVYKLINPKGIIYLKTDASYSSVEKIKHSKIRYILMKLLFGFSDVVSVESKSIMKELKQIINREYVLIPNGVFKCNKECDIPNKSKIILFVGRVDSPEKNVSLLIEAFFNANLGEKWKLKLVGPVSKQFIDQIREKYYVSSNAIFNNLEFCGAVYDRNELNDIYKKSAIFVLPSEYESYGIALVEALNCGCYLVGSENIPPFDEITNNFKFGCTINPHLLNDFSECLKKVSLEHFDDNNRINEQINFCNLNYSWPSIVGNLHTEILKFKCR